MKIQFDNQQPHQLEAVQAVVDLFRGQPLQRGEYEIDLTGMAGGLLTELGIGNQLHISAETILSNVQQIQRKHQLNVSTELSGLNFSIEMETGTGKTYVYLRTIHELHAKYGFKKYIIVVPSVAIREGVLKNLQLTREHFDKEYGHPPMDYWVYDSKRISSLRQFAAANQLQIMVINIDAFNKKDNNVIHKEHDRLSGRLPIEFIQATSPIVIMDEPQNMESEQARAAIQSMNPLCTLRYSATHRHVYNLLYQLNPVRAYELKLVKRIEVASVMEQPDYNQPYIFVESITATKSKVTAKLVIEKQQVQGPVRTKISVSKNGEDLYKFSGNREAYRDYIVDHIDAGSGIIAFANGTVLGTGQTLGGQTEDLMRVQIYETVKAHLEKELRITERFPIGRRMKVLSLFFIDRVANYADSDGKIRLWFKEAYQELSFKPLYRSLNLPDVDLVHNGYFASDGKGKAKDTSGNTKADNDAYELIMKDKERLLSLDEPLRFIFSHSALREGWDNPNVFQICTLNETKSTLKKRQEIGRGLRLPVDETGNRVFDASVNRLTVVANESYEDFARELQTEIENDCGVQFPKEYIDQASKRKKIQLVSKWKENQDFLDLWNRIKHKTRYSVHYAASDLIRAAAEAMRQMPAISNPNIVTQKRGIEITQKGVTTSLFAVSESQSSFKVRQIPDLIGYIQRETELTRGTIAEILVSSGRLGDLWVNPQQFLYYSAKSIREAMEKLMVDGIKYEKVAGAEYEMLLFEQEEIISYINRMIPVNHSIYEAIEYDSEIERQFAQEMDTRTDVKMFLKLPRWFQIDTPLGKYNPDWAIVLEPEGEEAKLYFVAETKSTHDENKRRNSENAKIRCGEAHFEIFPNVTFKTITSATEINIALKGLND